MEPASADVDETARAAASDAQAVVTRESVMSRRRM
jgi:hypothetical protein